MQRRAVPAALQLTPSSVLDFDPRHEVVLLCSPPHRAETSELAESLLALGFDAYVLSGALEELVEGLQTQTDEGRPLLLVPCDASTDTPVLRSRVGRSFHREYLWLDSTTQATAHELQRQICERMDALERERTQEEPIEPVDVDEVSNVVLLPTPAANDAPPPAAPTGSPPKRVSRIHMVLWPVLGAAITALGMTAMRGQTETTEPAAAVAVTDPAPTPTTAPPTAAPQVEPPTAAPAAAPDPVPPAEPPTAETPSKSDPLAAALTHERVTATDEYLVFAAGERPRDWYAAMNVCRGRAHAGVKGWKPPSSRQLHALAKARVLPESALWSRTRSLHDEDVAFVVHGKAGTTRSTAKLETLDAAVCIRKRDVSPDAQ